MDIILFIGLALIAFIGYYLFKNRSNKYLKRTAKVFPEEWRPILVKEINFYNSLNDEEKLRFESEVQDFLSKVKITGVGTTVEDLDRILVASSAVIPIFGFPQWRYNNICEVLLYPDMFDADFQTTGEGRSILGMVGNGYMDDQMILSKPALRHGFRNDSDKKNTAIHEFVHLIDEVDGTIDGIPKALMEKQYAIPWMDMINKKTEEIYKRRSDINPYGATNKAEFFSVASEYFFERPKLLEKKHPELYELMEEIFNQDMAERDLDGNEIKIVGRNNPCPCGSGLKYKRCCFNK